MFVERIKRFWEQLDGSYIPEGKRLIPLEYTCHLSPQEADEIYAKVADTLQEAQQRPYANIIARLRNHLSPGHTKQLTNAMGVLLPLSTQIVVLEGLTKRATTLNISDLNVQALLFMSKFRNTGVRAIHVESSPYNTF